MRKIFTLLFIFFLVGGLHSCNNDDNNNALPEATQTGADTFACLVDGKKFIDQHSINCFYQHFDGGYHFGIQGNNHDFNPVGISFGTTDKSISEGETLVLINAANGNAAGYAMFRTSPTNGQGSYTSTEYTGEFTITRLDFENLIVSGTFWFDVPHPLTGKKVEIREGRFDTHFSL